MRILAFSDVRSQPMDMLVRAVEQHRPDLILYGGDDVQRFGEVPQRAVAEAAVQCLSAAGARTGELPSRLGAYGLVGVRPFDERMDPRAPMARARVVELSSSFRAAAFPCAALGLVSYTVDEVTEALLELGLLDRVMSRNPLPWRELPEERRIRRFNYLARRIEVVEDGGETWAVYVWPGIVRLEPEGSWTELARRAPLGLAGIIGNDCHPLYRSILAQAPCRDLDAGPLLLSDGWAVLGLGGAPCDDQGGRGPNLYTRAQARAQLRAQLAQAGDRACILVTHAPPQGVLDAAIRFGSEDIGSSVVREIIADPRVRVVVCGHVHLLGGRQESVGHCRVVNVASHDHGDAPLRWAVLAIDGDRIEVELGQIASPEEIRRAWEVGPDRARKLQECGITSLEQLARTSEGELGRVIGPTFGQIASRHAATLLDQKPRRLAPTFTFPERVLYLDVETSHDRQDDPWLIGLHLPGEAPVRQLVELDPGRLGEQIDALDAILSRYANHRIVRWGSFDLGALRKAVRNTGRPAFGWLDPDRWLDANQWLRRTLALPVDGTGLKEIATHLGYPWRQKGLDGMMVGMMYARYRDRREPFPVQQVLEYNADDVLALPFVVNRVRWLFAQAR